MFPPHTLYNKTNKKKKSPFVYTICELVLGSEELKPVVTRKRYLDLPRLKDYNIFAFFF